MSGYDDSDVQEFLKRLERAQAIIDSEFMQAAKDIGLAFLKEVKEQTPKGLTGKLNQSWKMEVSKNGNVYEVIAFNPMEYASFVESGHRQQVGRYVPAIGKRLVNPWVEGRFMMRLTEEQIKQKIPQITQQIEERLKEELGGL